MNRKRRGELSELAFIYKATGLGFNVSKPYGDSSRYDFIVEHRGRLSKVQVKSTSQLFPTGGYYLNCQRRMRTGTFPYLVGEVDFFAAQVVPTDTWYIIPLSAIGEKYYVRFFPHQPDRDRLAFYREAWRLLEGPDPDSVLAACYAVPGLIPFIDACAVNQ
ncbi:MAG: group I intron-associated PD-(D/E)XK endonuclease [Terriglobales bacterium]